MLVLTACDLTLLPVWVWRTAEFVWLMVVRSIEVNVNLLKVFGFVVFLWKLESNLIKSRYYFRKKFRP